jgi:tetratricopeptide (TPR) repeat protein
LNEVLFGLGRAIADALNISRPQEEEATDEMFPQFLKRAIAALDSQPERLVLLFDEFDVIDQQFAGPQIAARRFVPYLADLISREPRIGYILVVGRKTEELSEGFFGAILKGSLQKRIGRLEREQVEKLVLDSFGTSVQVADSAVHEIFDLTAGHPYCVQVLCYTIWNRYCEKNGRAVIGATQVAESLPFAIQLGTNGLNWIYDGLEKPAHRLFLAALAMLAGAQARSSVSYSAIESALFERRVGIDESALHLTPRDLQSWDIIEGTTAGFQFTVPMIGLWIQQNRPLQELELETRLINPRASRYYELALDSQQRGDLDAAIEDFRNALTANPVYLEAQLGLASALRIRNQGADLTASIESYQRALDLDPNSARTPLQEALLEGMEAEGTDIEQVSKFFVAIQSLGSDDVFLGRARRILERMAAVRSRYGTTTYLSQAEKLFSLLGDREAAAEVNARRQRIEKAVSRSFAFWLGATALWVVAVFAARWRALALISPHLQNLLACLAGLAFTTAVATGTRAKASLERRNYVSLFAGLSAGIASGYLAKYWGVSSLWWLGFVAFWGAYVVSFAIMGTGDDVPPELERPVPRESVSTYRDRLAELLVKWAVGLRTSSSRKEKGS